MSDPQALRDLADEVTPRQVEMMRHALSGGYDVPPYRNYFFAGPVDVPAWDDLVFKGLAVRREIECVPEPVYQVTPKGRAILRAKAAEMESE